MHFALAARQGIFHQSTPLTLAETASVFGETIVFGRLLDEDSSPASRLALLAENLEDTIATVFRQVAMNRFEELVHTARREQGELSVERFGELWAESQAELLGDSVELTEGYRSWWSYIPHFIGTPGYVYAYAYGQLLALSVYERYEQLGAELVPQLPGAARRRRLAQPRGARARSSASTSPTRASGSRAWTSSSASSRKPSRPREASGGCSVARPMRIDPPRRRCSSASPSSLQPGAVAGARSVSVLELTARLAVIGELSAWGFRRCCSAGHARGGWPRSSSCRWRARACCARAWPASGSSSRTATPSPSSQALAQVA